MKGKYFRKRRTSRENSVEEGRNDRKTRASQSSRIKVNLNTKKTKPRKSYREKILKSGGRDNRKKAQLDTRSKHENILNSGGKLTIDRKRIVLSNTCSVDNLLYMTYQIMQLNRSCREWFNTNATSVPVCQILFDVYKHFRDGEWHQGRRRWLDECCHFSAKSNNWNVWGSESKRFVMPFSKNQLTVARSTCSLGACPRHNTSWQSKEIFLM